MYNPLLKPIPQPLYNKNNQDEAEYFEHQSKHTITSPQVYVLKEKEKTVEPLIIHNYKQHGKQSRSQFSFVVYIILQDL